MLNKEEQEIYSMLKDKILGMRAEINELTQERDDLIDTLTWNHLKKRIDLNELGLGVYLSTPSK